MMYAVQETAVPTGLIGTYIRNFKVEPTKVAVGKPVTISGYLKYWLLGEKALVGKNVELWINNQLVSEMSSGDEGYFAFAWIPANTGTYTLFVKFPGTGTFNSCVSPTVAVEVKTEQEIAQEERNFWIMVGAGVGLALLGIGVAVYLYRRERMMELMMARRG